MTIRPQPLRARELFHRRFFQHLGVAIQRFTHGLVEEKKAAADESAFLVRLSRGIAMVGPSMDSSPKRPTGLTAVAVAIAPCSVCEI